MDFLKNEKTLCFLGGLAAAVYALQHYQFTLAHFSSLAGHTLLNTSPILSWIIRSA